MKTRIQTSLAAVLATALISVFSTVSLRAGNLLVDPGFELQTPPSEGGWTLFNGAMFSSNFAHSGSWSMYCFSFYSYVVPGAFEQIPAAPGSQWRLTGYGLTPYQLFGSPAFGIVQVSFFDIFGNNLGTVETAGSGTQAKTSNQIDFNTPADQWQFMDTGIATAPPGTAYIEAFPLYVDFSGYYFQGVFFDDLDLEVLNVNHGGYVSSIAHNAALLQSANSITAAEASNMVSTAAMSAGGKGTVSYGNTLAYDNADLGDYYPQPNNNWSVDNGGFGYNAWTSLKDIPRGTGADGGTYMSGEGVEYRQVDGDYSFGLYSYGTGFDISRPLAAPLTSGSFSILTRFDVAGIGPNLINLRSGNNTASFSAGELLSFGINGNFDQAQLSYNDASGTHVLPSGEARGLIWQWTVDFNAATGVYSATVTDVDGISGYSASFTGKLEPHGTSVGSFAALNSSIGAYQNVIFDSPTFSKP